MPSPPLLGLLLALVTPAPGAQDFEFAEVTAAAGLDVALAGGSPGVSVGDYDGDGWMDVCLCGSADGRPRIFRNQLGDAAGALPGSLATRPARRPWFKDVSETVLPAERPAASLALFCDLDNDGDQDLLTVYRLGGSHVLTGLMYFENLGGYYEKGGSSPRIGFDPTPLGGLALADVDGDGDLDVSFAHNGGGNGLGGPGFLVRNDGLPHLVDDTELRANSFEEVRRYWSVVLADFTGDGLVDLHAAIDFGHDFHCRNVGGGVLQDASVEANTTNVGSDMGLAVGDIENDGDLDVYSTNISQGVLYVNDGTGVFTDEAQQRGASYGGLTVSIGWGTAFADFDHDRDQDLVFVAYGPGPGKLFENDGSGYFTDRTSDTDLFLRGHGLVAFDFDRDGDQDILVMRNGLTALASLYENRSPALAGRHWLTVGLVGTLSNRDGVGARVEVTAGGVTQVRPILAGSSFKSGPPMDAHFGLGDADHADQVVVRWPSGRTQTLTDVKADRFVTVKEPAR